MINSRSQSALIASLIFCAAALLALISFRHLAADINQPRDAILSIKNGKHYWHLIDTNGRCVGDFNLDFQQTPSSSILRGAGSISLRSFDRTVPLKFSLVMNFNDLGQLGASLVKISSDYFSASVGSANIAPITVRVRHQLDTQPQKIYDFSIPGPIFIETTSDGSSRLRYRFLDSFELPKSSSTFLAQLPSMQSSSQAQNCENVGLDIADLISQTQQLAQTLPDIEDLLRLMQ